MLASHPLHFAFDDGKSFLLWVSIQKAIETVVSVKRSCAKVMKNIGLKRPPLTSFSDPEETKSFSE